MTPACTVFFSHQSPAVLDVLDTLRNEADKGGDNNVYDQITVGNVYDYQDNTNKHRMDNMQNHEE